MVRATNSWRWLPLGRDVNYDAASRFIAQLEPLQRLLEVFSRRYLRDPDEVQDVLQTVVAHAYRDFPEFVEGTNFRAWIFRYVSFEVLNRNRAYDRHRFAELPKDVPARMTAPLAESGVGDFVETLLESPETVLAHCDEALSEAVFDLPPLERGIFLLRTIGEFKYREIADLLDVPIGTVMGLLSRSRIRLRRNLSEFGRERGLLPPAAEECA